MVPSARTLKEEHHAPGVIEPRVLLPDEPLSNLDAKLRLEMCGEMRVHQELGLTSIYATHDQAEALSLSDREDIG